MYREGGKHIAVLQYMEVHYQPAVELVVKTWGYTVRASLLILLSFHGSARNRRAVYTHVDTYSLTYDLT